eukprot:Pgem_evm1s7306
MSSEEFVNAELARNAQEAKELEEWFQSDRFKFIKRNYTAASVVGNKIEKKTSHTFGALDPLQVIQMAKYLDCVYVSGWQCSSTASSSNEPGPDLADYPMDTVPK